MLQQVEYEPGKFFTWIKRRPILSHVMHRQQLDWTKRAKLLVLATYCAWLGFVGVGIVLALFGLKAVMFIFWVVMSPFAVVMLLTLLIYAAKVLVVEPKNKKAIARSREVFSSHPATRIAIAGSYGKTTMKEVLTIILAEGKKVAATPGNKNMPSSHAQFAAKLNGSEEVLIIEYGEGKPGDIKQFTETTQPHIGVITGLAPAHLDGYKTVHSAGKDIMVLADYLGDKNVFINGESPDLEVFIKPSHLAYSQNGVGAWKLSDVKIFGDGMDFTLKGPKQTLNLHTGLLGRHLLGTLTAAVAIAEQLGFSKEQISRGIRKTVPYEHRMQPYTLAGALVIDDTYNGNLEGIRAGLALLTELEAKRKIYVTPGLVDQGEETARVHTEIGRLIAKAAPHIVVLIEHSVTKYIQAGLHEGGFKGELRLESDPLGFYTNLNQFVAAGDLVLMQNDWTDNYA
jgi:UDP-N-acetylmuramoyl-tripeptide--D-alanyl-D-alanine ligase